MKVDAIFTQLEHLIKQQFKTSKSGTKDVQFLQGHEGTDENKGKGARKNKCIPGDIDPADIVPGTNKEIWPIRCNKCKKWGHIAKKCPKVSIIDSSLSFSQMENLPTNLTRFYFDTGSLRSTTNHGFIMDKV